MGAAIETLRDVAAMREFGGRIAAQLQAGDVVALSGELGAGKTTLARAIIAALGHMGEVPSPSFTIIETYDPPTVRLPLVHADFYRLERPGEAVEIGLDDYREGAAMLAEWPEKAGGFAHEPGCLSITLEIMPEIGPEIGPETGRETGESGRKAIVEPGPAWVGRWP